MKQNRIFNLSILSSAIILFMVSCANQNEKQNNNAEVPVTHTPKIAAPDFNADSAYSYVKAQVDFGPRIPGTKPHEKCADYLVTKLKSFGFSVNVQSATLQTYDKKQFVIKNIIAQYQPEKQSRILLCSHWDTRPWADSDTKDKDKPFDSANDGPSGVGIALEAARNVNAVKPLTGVDIIFFDLEDYGEEGGDENTWCLGSQYWSKNLVPSNYYANFGVLLDMVGGPNATFPKESSSVGFASSIVDKIWKAGNEIGYGNHFVYQTRQFVGVDDHVYVNRAGIPCIDIIEYNQSNGAFGDYHHTHKDNMSGIDKNTLKAVGQTLLEVIYNEK